MKWPVVSRKLHDEKEWSSTINCNEYNSDRLNVNKHMNQVRNFNILKMAYCTTKGRLLSITFTDTELDNYIYQA